METASGAARPEMVDSFPVRGTSGYAATLHLVISHGKGETVLPRGLDLQGDKRNRTSAGGGGVSPSLDQDGGAAARLSSIDTDPKSGRRQTTLDLPLLALPKEPGRHTLVVPPSPSPSRERTTTW